MFSLWYFSLYSHWRSRFSLRDLCFPLCFVKEKSSSSDRRFHWRILRGIFPVKTKRKWRHFFIWILIHCKFIRYTLNLLTKECRQAWNFKYQNLVFSFLSYAIILLFPPIYMIIEHSFINYSCTAKINSAPL